MAVSSLTCYSISVWVHMFVCLPCDMSGLAEFLFRYSVITCSTLFCSRNTSFQMCSRNNIPSMDISIAFCFVTSICSSLLVVAFFLLSYNTTVKTVSMSSFVLVTSFIVTNAFHPDLIHGKISSFTHRSKVDVHFHLFDFKASHHDMALW